MAENNKTGVVKASSNNEYLLLEFGNRYYIADNTGEKQRIVCTPGGKPLNTLYYPLAEKLFEDVQKYGPQCRSAESILPWHYTLCDNFLKLEHRQVEEVLESSFLSMPDWTYDYRADETWASTFGVPNEREAQIREWLSKCTYMQMTAACCIGNAYESINVAFVLAVIMENFTGKDRKKQFKLLANLVAQNPFYGPASTIMKDFVNFDLYYGFHLDEEGTIINNTSFGIIAEKEENAFTVTEEMLVGRNYYHYTNGEKDETQPFSLNHDLVDYLSAEYEDEDDEEAEDEEEYAEELGDELSDNIPDDCWVKKICTVDEDVESHYIIAVEVKEGKVSGITALFDEVSVMGGGMFFTSGELMAESHSYEEIEIDENEAVKNEIEALKTGRYLPMDFSFVGKKLPEKTIENDKYNGDDTEYLICLQSAHRMAYVDLFITTDEDGIVEDFDYSTYQSTGSGYGDMFSRPQMIDDMNEEAIDTLLSIIDAYTDDEYKENVRESCTENSPLGENMGLFGSEKSKLSKEERYGQAWLNVVGGNRDKGLAEFKKLHEEGFIEGTIALSMFTTNERERLALYQTAAEAGNYEGLWEYSGALRRSFNPKWEEYCLQAAESGSPDAMNEMGNVYHRRQNYAEAMYWYAMANFNDHPEGKIGMMGIAREWQNAGCPVEFVPGSPKFNKDRHTAALYYLEMYGGEEDDATVEATDILRLAEAGVSLAAYSAGDNFEMLEQDEMAFRTYQLSSLQADPHAMRCVADMMICGKGTKKDETSAVTLYKLAAEMGERTSMFTVGMFTQRENKNMAAYWYGMAHVRGYQFALMQLQKLA